MENMSGDLGINTEVIEKMVSLAALEVEGVAKMSNRSLDISGIINTGSAFKPVRVSMKNGAALVDVYIAVKTGINVKEVAEAVQRNVKDKVQDMTGNAITRVNVHIADLDIPEATDEN
ncbi:MAG: Asp23/Gls24 family envelope stress response protein [Clostridiales bacterium]|nr:Asp23/Gls24 family envelope stress response protein [Candidatus Equinaster intestinalis]